MPHDVRLHVVTRSNLEDAYAAAYGEPIDVDDREIERFEAMAARALTGCTAKVDVIEDEELVAYSTPSQEEWYSDERVKERDALFTTLREWAEETYLRRH